MATVVRGGTVVTATGRFTGDVRVRDGRIEAVGLGVAAPGDTVFDASGCFVLPGGIDPHTHVEMPIGGGEFNAETWYTGTVAAAFGGTTTVIDHITQERGGSLSAVLEDWLERAGPQAVVDYGFHMGIIDPRPEVLEEIPVMVSRGVPSFKLYTAYRGRLMLNDGEIFAVMRAVARQNGLVLAHTENGDVIEALVAEAIADGRVGPEHHASTRPAAAEAEATQRLCRLAEMAGARLYVVHVTCKEALFEIFRARRRGPRVLAETCTHYLLFTEKDLARPDFEGAKFVCSPALRTPGDQHTLWTALATGEVEAVGSDHCPWSLAQKRRGADRFDRIPMGAPGLEERIPFLYTYGVQRGLLSLEQMVAVTSTNAAQIFGLYPRKGAVAPGADADLVIWDPTQTRTWAAASHHSKTDNTPYEGMPVEGAVRHVLVRGRPVIQNGELTDAAGSGKFLSR